MKKSIEKRLRALEAKRNLDFDLKRDLTYPLLLWAVSRALRSEELEQLQKDSIDGIMVLTPEQEARIDEALEVISLELTGRSYADLFSSPPAVLKRAGRMLKEKVGHVPQR